MRQDWQIEFQGEQIEVVVVGTPEYFPKDDAYRDVFVKLPGGWRKGVFCCYPDDSATRTWERPVEWDDGKFLYIPTLEKDSIRNGLQYLMDGGSIGETLEECHEPDEVLANIGSLEGNVQSSMSDEIESKIRANIYNSFVLMKSLGKGKSKSELSDALVKYGNDILDSERM